MAGQERKTETFKVEVNKNITTVEQDDDNEVFWQNLPEATPAMKRSIEHFKERVKNNNEPWDAGFTL
ncbi:MAG: hypothetical protein N5P05_004296 (plasmid) [Chroococcopsis gigantea SAG 12.99]|jgi:hypothetical protein|nr:hypothetical protein [Chroococcopsis gigantea SAG 12.99]